jgi:DNA-binding NarL/FixJ family response regulator
MTTGSIRVVIADDHPIVLDGLHSQISRIPNAEIVGTAHSFAEVRGILSRVQADILILDLLGMGSSPLTMASELKRTVPTLKTIVFSSSVDLAPELLDAGARGYLTKEEMPGDLTQAILTVQGGGTFLSQNVRSYLDQTAHARDLTPQELLLLKLNAQGCSTSEIAEQMAVDPRTVNNYFSQIRRKIGCPQRVQMSDWYRRVYGDV